MTANITVTATFRTMPDMMPPSITLPDFSTMAGVTGWSGGPIQTFTVRYSPFPLTFTLEDNSGPANLSIKVNGVVIVDTVGIGSITYLVPLTEGHNDVEISASDAGGNYTSLKLVINLDSTAPVLTIEPALPASVTKSVLTITGDVTDAGSGLKTLTINGTEVIPLLDDSFRATLVLMKGANAIVIETEDKAGNKASVTYTVTYATSGSVASSKTVTLTIGKAEMDVNGIAVALDAAPVIQNGRTLLPLRFIAENLGLDLAWDALTRTISFTYWP